MHVLHPLRESRQQLNPKRTQDVCLRIACLSGAASLLLSLHYNAAAVCFCTCCAAVQTGLQEKATFLQVFGKKAVYSSFIRLPAFAVVLLLVTVLLVLWQYAAPPAGATRRQQVEYSPVVVDTSV